MRSIVYTKKYCKNIVKSVYMYLYLIIPYFRCIRIFLFLF